MKWFGLKKSKNSDSLYEMAHQLHLERRLHPRVRLPCLSSDFSGPSVRFENVDFPIWDISEGGVCLLDEEDLLRSKVGQKFSIQFQFPFDSQDVKIFEINSKLVASNLNRKHIQFETPSTSFVEFLRPWISIGLRGVWMKDFASMQNASSHGNSPARFKLLWGSILDDSLISSTDLRWEFELFLKGTKYCVSLSSWPSAFDTKVRVSPYEFDLILTFFSNIDSRLFEGHADFMKKLGDIRSDE